jgi:hypothetical protein
MPQGMSIYGSFLVDIYPEMNRIKLYLAVRELFPDQKPYYFCRTSNTILVPSTRMSI